ncbi:zinc finger protein 267-like [Saccostrea cucullata]|uniref:zinc finger protein 267-like n=1 Tax=Saccostrea cuccullata TaxID=36930 RepID=UPI002ED36F85
MMDLGCNIEFNFPESSQLADTVFGGTNTSINDKLGLGTGQLLDTVSGTAQCVGHHDTAIKHLSATDFQFDLGPTNDLVSTTDFPLGSDAEIGTDSVEECSEGYSIVNAALEGGGVLHKHPILSSNTLNLGNVTNIQPIQLNQTNLLGMSTIQIIPIENMQLLSSIKSQGHCRNIQSSSAYSGLPFIQRNSPAAVLLGNVLLLQSLPKQFNENSLSYSSISTQPQQSSLQHNQVLQISNDSNTTLSIQNTSVLDSLRGKVVNEILDEGMTIKTLLEKNSRNESMQIKGQIFSKDKESQVGMKQSLTCCTERDPAEEYVDKQTDTECLSHAKELSDNQKNTKILVYGKNIALTFDCRNQNFVMESLTKAMKGSQVSSQEKVNIHVEIQKLIHANECANIPKEVKYVSILNPPTSKSSKNDPSEMCFPRTAVKKGDNETRSSDKILESEKQTSSKVKLKGKGSSVANRRRSSHDQICLEHRDTEDKVAVLAVVKQDPRSNGSSQKEEEYVHNCDLCSATFSRIGNYTRHRMIHTLNTQDNYRYKCSECGRLFLQRCDMKRHMLIHTKQEPHRCAVCDKGYIRKSDLVVHMRFHSKERAYKCIQCEKQFFQSGDLNRHVRKVHLLVPLQKCGHCNKQFVKESTLIRHMQTTHKEIFIKSLRTQLDQVPLEKQEVADAREGTSVTDS